MKKIITFDFRARKELFDLPQEARDKINSRIETLSIEGELQEPEAKKLDKNLYEIRIKVKLLWRVFYGYLPKNEIIILRIFQKTTQKTPKNEIETAQKRLKQYI